MSSFEVGQYKPTQLSSTAYTCIISKSIGGAEREKHMATGDILFYHSDDLGGKLIQFWTHGPYTHVCIEVDNKHVIEAKWPVVSLDVEGTPAWRYTPKLDHAKLPAALAWLHTTIGSHYDFFDIIANAFPFIVPNTRIVRTPTAYICSELAAYFLQKAGCAFPANFLPDERSMSLVTPNSLARTLGILV